MRVKIKEKEKRNRKDRGWRTERKEGFKKGRKGNHKDG